MVGLAIYANHESKIEKQNQRGLAAIRGAVTTSQRSFELGFKIVLAAAEKQAAADAAAEAERVRQAQVAAEEKARADYLATLQEAQAAAQAPLPAIEPAPAPQGDYWSYIQQVCAKYGCSASELYAVMICESHGNMVANESGSGAYGVMQFMSGTFYGNCVLCDYNNPYHQIDTAARMFAQGQQGQWSCKG